MWACKWFTANSGKSHARQIALAAVSPTSSEPARPGVLATATASRSASVMFALRSASSMTGRIRSTWAREAISGTTPPNRWCSASCEATTEESTSSWSVTTAAAVSSQVVSMVRRRIGSCRAGSWELEVVQRLPLSTSYYASSFKPHVMHPRRRHVGQHQVAADFGFAEQFAQDALDAAEPLAVGARADERLWPGGRRRTRRSSACRPARAASAFWRAGDRPARR